MLLLHTVMINASGNTTVIVLDPIEADSRCAVAAAILEEDPSVEQVGFLARPRLGGAGRLEMMGGEFCGNATRSFGYWLANSRHHRGCHTIFVEVSGAPSPVPVAVDLDLGTAVCEMPLPLSIAPMTVGGLGGKLVVFEGISHLVLPGALDHALLEQAQQVLSKTDAAAWGVLFFDGKNQSMVPVVTVRSTNSTVVEGSCGSGSIAVAALLAQKLPDGTHRFLLSQPAGEIEVILTASQGTLAQGSIGGALVLDPARLRRLRSISR